MKILVLDTIHGGTELAGACREIGHEVDEVDVYRRERGISAEEAESRSYDLILAPVHLDPDYPLLRSGVPVRTHHEGVRMVLGPAVPHPFVELTGARGKTTTAHALAHLLPGPGVLHTSDGCREFPARVLLWRKSVTPASVIPAARHALAVGGWCIAEESLGVSGAGDLAVLTSVDDYPIAGGKKRALAAKSALVARAPLAIVPPESGMEGSSVISADRIAGVSGTTCTYRHRGISGSFSNPLLAYEGYRTPLILATAAACLLRIDPGALASFSPVPGRMTTTRDGDVLILDNSNSGTNAATAMEGASAARGITGSEELVLVIGTESRTICEGFPPADVATAIEEIRPASVIIVGDRDEYAPVAGAPQCTSIPVSFAPTLSEGAAKARSVAVSGSILLSVKTWR